MMEAHTEAVCIWKNTLRKERRQESLKPGHRGKPSTPLIRVLPSVWSQFRHNAKKPEPDLRIAAFSSILWTWCSVDFADVEGGPVHKRFCGSQRFRRFCGCGDLSTLDVEGAPFDARVIWVGKPQRRWKRVLRQCVYRRTHCGKRECRRTARSPACHWGILGMDIQDTAELQFQIWE